MEAMNVEKFNEFLNEIDEHAKSIGFTSPSVTSETGSDCWYDYWANGKTAKEAFEEDMNAG